MPPLCHTPPLQPHLKFCPKQAKTSYFDWYARPKPKHNLLILFHQHGNQTSKEFSWMFSSLEVKPRSLRWESVLYQGLIIHTIISVGLFKWRVYRLPEVRRHRNSLYPCYPFEYTLSLFLQTPVVPSMTVIFASRDPPQKCVNSKYSDHIIIPFKNHQSHSNNPYAIRGRDKYYIIHRMDRAKTFEYDAW